MNLEQYLDHTYPLRRQAKGKQSQKEINGAQTLEMLDDYVRDSDWTEMLSEKGEGRQVVQVLVGEYLGETWDRDGRVFKPRGTMAVFDPDILDMEIR